MGKRKKKTEGMMLTWLGIILIVLASLADFVLIFFDHYSRNLLLTVPVWVLGFGCFVLVGRQEQRKKQ